MAQFSPGEAGDVAHLGVGFWGQTVGLMLMLGGVIVQFDAGNNSSVGNRRFQMFPTQVRLRKWKRNMIPTLPIVLCYC